MNKTMRYKNKMKAIETSQPEIHCPCHHANTPQHTCFAFPLYHTPHTHIYMQIHIHRQLVHVCADYADYRHLTLHICPGNVYLY